MQALPNAGKPVDGDYPQPTTTTLPILTLGNDDTATWDYAVFLQAEQDDIGYLAEESSTSRATPPPIMSASPTSASSLSSVSSVPLHPLAPRQHRRISPAAALTPYSHGDAVHGESSMSHGTQAQPRQRLERRGHTKSRRGCFNCKRRRIKCQETRPACGHCVKQGLKCEYPALPTIVHQPQHQIPIFSLQDMRFFQHFLLNCYPHHPLGSEDLWLHDIPCLSQKACYSASSLISPAEPTLASAAMAHRLKAIRAIKKSLADASRQQQQHHRRQHQHQHQHQHQEGQWWRDRKRTTSTTTAAAEAGKTAATTAWRRRATR
ncbi:4ace3030-7343-43cb-828f-eb6824488e51 [Thermothielavioides terrestris]|uniref:4ace3030-7343-43cb-828f-eb6824488e51 n=1 Tax=Thermothielavioides terrestris TaxID=2587410 RepID=A0A446BXY8_9PEZI|nr:4ace3030-7343-43cb-828f-eb6824488e51 [Thermothielavioides terrestris]